MAGGLSHAITVTRGWNGYRKKSAQKVNSGEENYPASPAGYRNRELPITSPALYHWAITPGYNCQWPPVIIISLFSGQCYKLYRCIVVSVTDHIVVLWSVSQNISLFCGQCHKLYHCFVVSIADYIVVLWWVSQVISVFFLCVWSVSDIMSLFRGQCHILYSFFSPSSRKQLSP